MAQEERYQRLSTLLDSPTLGTHLLKSSAGEAIPSYMPSSPADPDYYAATRVKRTESLQGGGLCEPRIELITSGNDEGTDLMSRRVFVNYDQLVTKPEVEVRGNDVDVVSRTEAHRRACRDSDHVLFWLWLADNSAETHATDHHHHRCNSE